MRHWFAHWTESVKKVAISKAKRPPEKVVVLYISALLPHNKVARDGDALRLATLTRYDILLYQFFVIMFNKSLANTGAFPTFLKRGGGDYAEESNVPQSIALCDATIVSADYLAVV